MQNKIENKQRNNIMIVITAKLHPKEADEPVRILSFDQEDQSRAAKPFAHKTNIGDALVKHINNNLAHGLVIQGTLKTNSLKAKKVKEAGNTINIELTGRPNDMTITYLHKNLGILFATLMQPGVISKEATILKMEWSKGGKIENKFIFLVYEPNHNPRDLPHVFDDAESYLHDASISSEVQDSLRKMREHVELPCPDSRPRHGLRR